MAAQGLTCGREAVTIYRRKTPQGGVAFMVANYPHSATRAMAQANKGFSGALGPRDVRIYDGVEIGEWEFTTP
jgi:hypothetical protein